MDSLINCLNWPQTLKCRKNCSIDLIPNSIKNSNFLSNLYSTPAREVRKTKLKSRDRVWTSDISKNDLPFMKGHSPQFTEEVFEFVAISSRKPPIYAIKVEQYDIASGTLHQISCSNSFNKRINYNRFGFKCICASFCRQHTQLFYETFTRATEAGSLMGASNFGYIPPVNAPICHRGKFHVFWWKNF